MQINLNKLADLYDLEEGISRTPEDDDLLELKMSRGYRTVFKYVRRLIRILNVSAFVVALFVLVTRSWWMAKPAIIIIMLPNFLLAIVKQQMRKYAKRNISGRYAN